MENKESKSRKTKPWFNYHTYKSYFIFKLYEINFVTCNRKPYSFICGYYVLPWMRIIIWIGIIDFWTKVTHLNIKLFLFYLYDHGIIK